jgi:RNA polymerase sigma-70 factor (ECF subfamily)
MADLSLHQQMVKALPHLRAFAISLTGNVDRADDLVQHALLNGLRNLEKFQPGTNMQAWLFTILRNLFYSEIRKRRREVEDVDGLMAARVPVLPEQQGRLDMSDLQVALAKLSPEHREVLLLVGAEGLSYEEAARICGVKIGTIKSRMNRARARLAEFLSIDDADDLGSGRQVQSILARTAHSRAPENSIAL